MTKRACLSDKNADKTTVLPVKDVKNHSLVLYAVTMR